MGFLTTPTGGVDRRAGQHSAFPLLLVLGVLVALGGCRTLELDDLPAVTASDWTTEGDAL